MANGDDAIAQGMDVVLGTDDRRKGYDEINKSRDYTARLQRRFRYGTADPTGGQNGDIYFKIV